MLHEEMFDHNNKANTDSSSFWPVRQELYQLWLNVPAAYKFTKPTTVLLGGPDETPLIVTDNSQTLLLAGSLNGHHAAAPLVSEICLAHVQIAPGGTWTYHDVPFATVALYVRKGSGLQCEDADIPVHHMAYMDPTGDQLVLHNTDTENAVDFLLLAGEPIREPFMASGSMVMNTPGEINQAYADYERGLFGAPWDHKLSDKEWMEHVQKTSPNRRIR
jgi:redox-sensitive bicupin YhaK (pirin superfamily)